MESKAGIDKKIWIVYCVDPVRVYTILAVYAIEEKAKQHIEELEEDEYYVYDYFGHTVL